MYKSEESGTASVGSLQVSSDRTCGNGSALCQGKLRPDIRSISSPRRVIRLWNRLPRVGVGAPGLSVRGISKLSLIICLSFWSDLKWSDLHEVSIVGAFQVEQSVEFYIPFYRNGKGAESTCQVKLEDECCREVTGRCAAGCQPLYFPFRAFSSPSVLLHLCCCPPSRAFLLPYLPPAFCSRLPCSCALKST